MCVCVKTLDDSHLLLFIQKNRNKHKYLIVHNERRIRIEDRILSACEGRKPAECLLWVDACRDFLSNRVGCLDHVLHVGWVRVVEERPELAGVFAGKEGHLV